MRDRVVIGPEAENDLKEAFSWYEDKRQGLGYDFLLQVDAGLRFIERNPKIFPPEYKGTRKYLVKRFPYKIIYLLEEERITVLAVIHGKRSPILTKKRINST
ncbi:MAG: type II toxin-antitoxin system RelE/ParE family toxin [Candidatus Desantisbacteria bacterium]